jgi:hypothetical protein
MTMTLSSDLISNTPTIIKTTFKLRRGTAERWNEINPVLA